MADIACTWMSDLYGLRADREQVERLTSRMSTLTVFVTPEWFECAAEALRPDRTLSVLVLTRDDISSLGMRYSPPRCSSSRQTMSGRLVTTGSA